MNAKEALNVNEVSTIIVGIGKYIFSNSAFKYSLSKTYNTSLPGTYSADNQGGLLIHRL